MRIHYNQGLKTRSRQLRRAGVLSEVLLWREIRGRKLGGQQFTRQKPIENFIVDFYCSRLGLVIEIEGTSHNSRLAYDLERQRKLESLGLHVLRFLDSDVKQNLAGVVARIAEWVNQHTSSTTP